jgi:hypothetical protein
MDGTAAVGTSLLFGRQDHVHPSDTSRVAKAGDTMTGDLTIAKTNPTLLLIKQATGQNASIVGYNGSFARWAMLLGNTNPESGSNLGSDFALVRYNDAGTFLDAPLTISRTDGFAYVGAPPLGDNTNRIATTAFVKANTPPFEAMAYNGIQINGAMLVNQATPVNTWLFTSGAFASDGWRMFFVGPSAPQIINTAPSAFPGFTQMLQMLPGVAEPSLAVGSYAMIQQGIEGTRISRLAWGTPYAAPLTIGFWTGHHRPGLYSGAAYGASPNNRSYAFTYTQAGADAPQYNVVTIPGDTAGTWANDNTAQLSIDFAMASGTQYTAPSANAWVAGTFVAAPGQVNSIASTADVFRFGGVTMLAGNAVPSAVASPLAVRPYTQELEICKRYYRKLGGENSCDLFVAGYGTASGAVAQAFPLAPAMRAAPSATPFGTIGLTNVAAATYYSSTTTLSLLIQPAAVGQMSYFGNPGGVILDARI